MASSSSATAAAQQDGNAEVKAHYDTLLGRTYTWCVRPIQQSINIKAVDIRSTPFMQDDGRRRAQLGGEREVLPAAWPGARSA